MVYIYLFFLLIAPQLWVPGFVGFPIDMVLYPLWIVVLIFKGRGKLLIRFDLPDKLLLAFFGWMILSAVANGLTDPSKNELYSYLRMLVLYKLVSASVASMAEVRRVLWSFALLSAVLAVEAIHHKASPDLLGWAGQSLGWVDPSVLEAGGTGRARWVGIFDGPGVFCVVFTVAVGFCLPFIGGGNRWFTTWLAFALAVLTGWATYLTGSRGGFLATLAILSLFIAVRRKISMTKIVTAAVLSAAVFVLAPASLTSTRDESKSAQYRVEMWAAGLTMIKEDPVLGVGRGNFRSYTGRLIAHNSAIEIAGETGLIGLMLWGTLFYVCLRSAVTAWHQSLTPSDSSGGLGLVLALVGYFVSAMFVTLEYETWYLLLALCAALSRHQPNIHLTIRDIAIVSVTAGSFLAFLQFFVVIYMT